MSLGVPGSGRDGHSQFAILTFCLVDLRARTCSANPCPTRCAGILRQYINIGAWLTEAGSVAAPWGAAGRLWVVADCRFVGVYFLGGSGQTTAGRRRVTPVAAWSLTPRRSRRASLPLRTTSTRRASSSASVRAQADADRLCVSQGEIGRGCRARRVGVGRSTTLIVRIAWVA